jgi:hypothetical protein
MWKTTASGLLLASSAAVVAPIPWPLPRKGGGEDWGQVQTRDWVVLDARRSAITICGAWRRRLPGRPGDGCCSSKRHRNIDRESPSAPRRRLVCESANTFDEAT